MVTILVLGLSINRLIFLMLMRKERIFFIFKKVYDCIIFLNKLNFLMWQLGGYF